MTVPRPHPLWRVEVSVPVEGLDARSAADLGEALSSHLGGIFHPVGGSWTAPHALGAVRLHGVAAPDDATCAAWVRAALPDPIPTGSTRIRVTHYSPPYAPEPEPSTARTISTTSTPAAALLTPEDEVFDDVDPSDPVAVLSAPRYDRLSRPAGVPADLATCRACGGSFVDLPLALDVGAGLCPGCSGEAEEVEAILTRERAELDAIHAAREAAGVHRVQLVSHSTIAAPHLAASTVARVVSLDDDGFDVELGPLTSESLTRLAQLTRLRRRADGRVADVVRETPPPDPVVGDVWIYAPPSHHSIRDSRTGARILSETYLRANVGGAAAWVLVDRAQE